MQPSLSTSLEAMDSAPRVELMEKFCHRVRQQLQKERRQQRLTSTHRGGVKIVPASRYVDAVWQTWLEDLSQLNWETPPGLAELQATAAHLRAEDAAAREQHAGNVSPGVSSSCLTPPRFGVQGGRSSPGRRSPGYHHRFRSPTTAPLEEKGIALEAGCGGGLAVVESRSSNNSAASGTFHARGSSNLTPNNGFQAAFFAGHANPSLSFSLQSSRGLTSGTSTGGRAQRNAAKFFSEGIEVLTLQEIQLVLSGDRSDEAYLVGHRVQQVLVPDADGLNTTVVSSASQQKQDLFEKAKRARKTLADATALRHSLGTADPHPMTAVRPLPPQQKEDSNPHQLSVAAIAERVRLQQQLQQQEWRTSTRHATFNLQAAEGAVRVKSVITPSSLPENVHRIAMLWPPPGITRDGLRFGPAEGPLTTSTGGWATAAMLQQHSQRYHAESSSPIGGHLFQELTASEFSGRMFDPVPAARSSPFVVESRRHTDGAEDPHARALNAHCSRLSVGEKGGQWRREKQLHFDVEQMPPVVTWGKEEGGTRTPVRGSPVGEGNVDVARRDATHSSSRHHTPGGREEEAEPRRILDPFFLETVLSRLPALRSLVLCDTPLPPIDPYLMRAAAPLPPRHREGVTFQEEATTSPLDPDPIFEEVEEEFEEEYTDDDDVEEQEEEDLAARYPEGYHHPRNAAPLALGVNAVLGLPIGYRNPERWDTPILPPPIEGFLRKKRQPPREKPRRKTRVVTRHVKRLVTPPRRAVVQTSPRRQKEKAAERVACAPFAALRELHIHSCTLSGGLSDPLALHRSAKVGKIQIAKTPKKPLHRSAAPGSPGGPTGFRKMPPAPPPVLPSFGLADATPRSQVEESKETSTTLDPTTVGQRSSDSRPGSRRPPPLQLEPGAGNGECVRVGPSENPDGNPFVRSATASHPGEGGNAVLSAMRLPMNRRPSWTLSSTGVALDVADEQQYPRGGSRYGIEAKELARLMRIGERRLLALEDGRQKDKTMEDYVAARFGDGELTDLQWIAFIPFLHHLSLDRCSLQDQSMSWIKELKHLRFFSSTHSNIRRVDWLKGVSGSLTDLCLAHCPWLIDVSGIAHLGQLQHLSLAFTPIRDTAFVDGCPQLQSLHLVGCRRLVHAEAIGRLRFLRSLNVSRTMIEDISWLSTCSPNSLECVDVSYCHQCPPGAVAVLAELPRLKYANISGMYMDAAGPDLNGVKPRTRHLTESGDPEPQEAEAFSLKWIARCRQLKELWFLDVGDDVTDLAAIASIAAQLKVLHMCYTSKRSAAALTHVRWISQLQNLTRLNLSDNTDLQDVQSITSLRGLTELSLANTAVDAHSVKVALIPSACGTLEGLDLSYCTRVETLEFLDELPHLRKLYLCGTRLRNLDFGRCCAHLEVLHASDCLLLRDADGLKHATQLRELRLDYSPVISLQWIPFLKQLESLNLAGCSNVLEYDRIAHLTQLKVLDLSYSCVCEVSWLPPLQQLEELYLRSCTGILAIYEAMELRHLRVLNIYGTDVCVHKERLHSLRQWALETGVTLLYLAEDTFAPDVIQPTPPMEGDWRNGPLCASSVVSRRHHSDSRQSAPPSRSQQRQFAQQNPHLRNASYSQGMSANLGLENRTSNSNLPPIRGGGKR